MSITVVIPSYKAEKTIAQAVTSVLESERLDVKIIVVEDGIYDNTSHILKSFDGRVVLHTMHENQGAQIARNFGLSLVDTKFVMFLDADDFLKPSFLFNLQETLSESSADLAFGVMEKLYEDTGKIKIYKPPIKQSRYQIAERWLRGQPGPHPCGVLWKTDVVRAIGGWHEGMSRNQDGEIILRALAYGYEVAVSTVSASVYRCHSGVRVSKTASEHSFHCQKVIISLLEEWMAREPDFDLKSSLAEFCVYVAIKAYKSGLDEIGLEWEKLSLSYKKHSQLIWFGSLKRRAKFSLITALGVKRTSAFVG